MLWRVGGEKTFISLSAEDVWRCLTLPFPLCRMAYRDIGGSDPERMAAPRVADYVEELFKNSPVMVQSNIIS